MSRIVKLGLNSAINRKNVGCLEQEKLPRLKVWCPSAPRTVGGSARVCDEREGILFLLLLLFLLFLILLLLFLLLLSKLGLLYEANISKEVGRRMH
jgi:hypothetical protein